MGGGEGNGVEGVGGGAEGTLIMSFLPESWYDKNGYPLFLELQSLTTSALSGLVNITEALSVFPIQVSVWLTPTSHSSLVNYWQCV